MKHTPGTWHITEYTKAINPKGTNQRFATIRSGTDYWVADALPLDCEHGEADARLIAAAPELLAEAQNQVATIDYVMKWLEAELATIERRCDASGITGAHKQSDMLAVGVVIENLKTARLKQVSVIDKVRAA